MPKRRIPLEELASLPSVQMVTPSWSGEKVAFYWDKTGRYELYLMDLRTRAVQQLTDGQAPRSLRAGFVWTRDDAAIIFARDVDGNERHNLFRLDIATGSVAQLNDDPTTQEYPAEVAPDNETLAVLSTRNGQMNLFTLGMTSGQWQQLTRFEAPVWHSGGFSPDGRWLAVTSNEAPTLSNTDGYVVSTATGEVRKLLSVREGSQDAVVAWHPSGEMLAVSSDAGGTSAVGVLTLATGEVRWLSPEGIDEEAGHFSQHGEWLAVIRNQDATMMPVLYHVATGKERRLNLPPGVAMGGHFVLDDTKLLIRHGSSNRRADVLLYDLAADTYEVLIPAEYGSVDPDLFVTDEYVHYPSFDGQQVPALLYKPRDIAPGQRLPALVVVHGGPTWQFFRSFDLYAQFLVDQGYVLLEPNVRGSTGYGVTWRDANLKDWGGGDLEDVAAGADYLRTLPFVDPERIGIFGGSYGGYMSFLATVKKPDHFKVGIPLVGISDLQLLHATNMPPLQYYLRQQMGDPEENPKLWQDRSAITHAANLKAKLLIMHGINDPRCPISQARTFRDRLVELGRQEGADFEYHEFADEGHGPGGDVQQKLRSYRLLADFLERCL